MESLSFKLSSLFLQKNILNLTLISTPFCLIFETIFLAMPGIEPEMSAKTSDFEAVA